MSQIFSIVVCHKGQSYPALLTVSGQKKEEAEVRVIPGQERIEVIMKNGSLSFYTSELIARLLKADAPASESQEIMITSNISLRLLNNEWW